MEMAVIGLGQDMELLASVSAVAVADQAQVLEYIQRPIDGGGDGLRVRGAASLDQLGRRDVPLRVAQDAQQ